MNTNLLKSRKFWAAVLGLGLVLLRAYAPNFPVSDEQLLTMGMVLVSYIVGVALEDAGKKQGGQGA